MVSTTNGGYAQLSSPNQRVGGSIPSRRTIRAGHRPAVWRSSYPGAATHYDRKNLDGKNLDGRQLPPAQTLVRRVPDAVSRRRAAAKRGLLAGGEDRRTIDRRECGALDRGEPNECVASV